MKLVEQKKKTTFFVTIAPSNFELLFYYNLISYLLSFLLSSIIFSFSSIIFSIIFYYLFYFLLSSSDGTASHLSLLVFLPCVAEPFIETISQRLDLFDWFSGSIWSLLIEKYRQIAFTLIILHSTENPIYVFPEKELSGLSPNSYIHVSVSDFYIPRIGPHIWLQQNRHSDRSWKYINLSQIYESRN